MMEPMKDLNVQMLEQEVRQLRIKNDREEFELIHQKMQRATFFEMKTEFVEMKTEGCESFIRAPAFMAGPGAIEHPAVARPMTQERLDAACTIARHISEIDHSRSRIVEALAESGHDALIARSIARAIRETDGLVDVSVMRHVAGLICNNLVQQAGALSAKFEAS